MPHSQGRPVADQGLGTDEDALTEGPHAVGMYEVFPVADPAGISFVGGDFAIQGLGKVGNGYRPAQAMSGQWQEAIGQIVLQQIYLLRRERLLSMQFRPVQMGDVQPVCMALVGAGMVAPPDPQLVFPGHMIHPLIKSASETTCIIVQRQPVAGFSLFLCRYPQFQ